MEKKVKIGLVGVGLNTYWGQFEELRERLLDMQEEVRYKMGQMEAEVVDCGMVDSPEKASLAMQKLESAHVEVLFVSILTYALSSMLLPIVRSLNRTVILLAIQPVPAMDYEAFNRLTDRKQMTGEWLAHCQACSLPEFSCVLNRAKIPYDVITGFLNEEYV